MSDDRVTSAREPADFAFRQVVDVAAYRLDKQKLGELCLDQFAARTRSVCFVDGVTDRTFQPLVRLFLNHTHLQDRRQAGKQNVAEVSLARHEAADKLRDVTAAAEPRQF